MNMRKLCTILAIAILIPFAWINADEDQGPIEKTASATKTAAKETAETIKHGAKATGSVIVRGAKATERTVDKVEPGNKRESGATPTHVHHRTTHRSATAKASPTVKESPTGEASPTASPELNEATRPSPTASPEVNQNPTPETSPSPSATP